jgi:hypothetical protein
MTIMFKAADNEIRAMRFAPCAAGRLLLKPLSAKAKRVMAQKVLLSGRRLETRRVFE